MATNQQIINGIVAWAKAYAANDTYGYKRWGSSTKTHQCPLCHTDSGNGWNCIGFATAAIWHGGGVHDIHDCSCSGIGNTQFLTNVTLASWRNRNGNSWDMIDNGGGKAGNAIPQARLQAGDILLQYTSSGKCQHVMVYIGDGQIAHSATDTVAKAKQICIGKYSGRKVTRAFRFTGSGAQYTPWATSGNATTDYKKTFTRRTGPTSYSKVKNLIYYKTPNPLSINSATGGNCIWYAWGRFWEVWASALSKWRTTNPWSTVGGLSGNAYNWYASAKKNGKLKTGVIPKPGAIACWGYYGSAGGDPGHVAFVEKVNMESDGKTVKSIEISQSGWSSGPLKNAVLYPGEGKQGVKAYKLGFNNSYFNGFIYNPINFGNPAGATDSDYELSPEELAELGVSGESVAVIDMAQRISKLYSSDNFQYAEEEEKEEDNTFVNSIKQYLSNAVYTSTSNISAAIPEPIVGGIEEEARARVTKQSSVFDLSSALVEAPFVELDLGGYKIGSYQGYIDMYPNYVSSMSIKKTNGKINQYTINLIHQIRPGEDPNILDKLFSKVRYNPITITYSDSTSNRVFKDTKAIISNIAMNRDYAGSRIVYTVYALSASTFVGTYTTSFGSVKDKPSNIIRDLLYNSGEISTLLQESFPAMKDKLFVESNNLIPTNDAIISVAAKSNIDPLSYINYLVGCMSNSSNTSSTIIRNSTYYITYVDEAKGNYFKITEVSGQSYLTNMIYDVTIGYPDRNNIYNFNVKNSDAWALLYETGTSDAHEYVYSLDSSGNKVITYSPNLVNSTLSLNEMQKNWWTQMTQYPISAQLTLRGLLSPVQLMDYVNINVLFYGQKHITSGIYAITGQTDTLSADGFKTTLDLIRVQDN